MSLALLTSVSMETSELRIAVGVYCRQDNFVSLETFHHS
jgi:hypothetical protein